ncbi:MAG: hypothetical protein E7600_06365 [Ruminococcaceae bacterium]|nr:hypothetical protein [Oscillospiraceae bacterium]
MTTMKNIRNILAAVVCFSIILGINAFAAPSAVTIADSTEHVDSTAMLFEETEMHTHKVCGAVSCIDENHTGHESDVIYTAITQASTVDGVTVTMSGTSYKFTLAAGTADAPKTYSFYVDEDVTFYDTITVPAYTTLNICLNGNIISCNDYDFLLTTASGNTEINLCDCSEGVIHHGYLGELGTTGRLIWMQGEEVPEGCTELDLEGGVIDGYDSATTSSTYNNKALVNLTALTSEDTPVTFNMYGGNIAGHYRFGVIADKYTAFNFYDGRIAGNRMGIVTRTTNSVGATVNMYGGVVSHHIGDSYCGAAITDKSTFNLYGGEICYNENLATGTNRGAGVNNYGIVNMYGGSIHHNYSATDGGAVYNNGYLYMHDGSMTYNSANMGAAVYNYGGKSNGGFFMSGGTITQNTSLSKMNLSRGAIWLRPGDPATMFGGGGTFVVSGKPVVYDNFDVLGRQANIFVGTSQWQGKTRIDVGALEDGAKLGVFAYDIDGPVTYNWTASMADANPNDYFISDENPEYNKILVDQASGEVYIDGCEHDGEKTYEGTTNPFHLVTCGICKDVFDEYHTETTPADCLNLAYCEVCDTSYGNVSTSKHHESCTVSYTYLNANYHTATWDKCGYSTRKLHTKTTPANCTYANYCADCDSNYGSIAKGNHNIDENHSCTICNKTACASVLVEGQTEPAYYIDLDAAFDAVEGKATITLLRDIDDLLSSCYVNDGDDITLDFNGHNITTSSNYYFNVTKSKKTDYDFARLNVIGSGKFTYNKAGSRTYAYSPFSVSTQQNSAATGSGFPELIIGGDIIVETTENYAVPVKVESNNPAVESYFTLKDNAKLISNYSGGVVFYSEPASSGIQGGINVFLEGGTLVNNAGTTLVGYNTSSRYYDGTLANVYVDVPDIVSVIPNTYYLISHNLEEEYGDVDFTSGNTIVNDKNYALENTSVSFTVTPTEDFTLTSVSANDALLTASDSVYTFTTVDNVSLIVIDGEKNIKEIVIDLGQRQSESNVRYAEIDGQQSIITENNDKYTVALGEDNLLVEVTEKTQSGIFVKSQYFYADIKSLTATKLHMNSYMTSDNEKSIRTKGEMGIRFKSNILTVPKNEETDFEIVEYGFVVAASDVLGEEELTLDFPKIATGVAYSKEQGIDLVYDSTSDTQHVFAGVVKNLPVAKYRTDLVCKTYTKITVDGKQFILYGEAVKGNIYDTAKAALEDETLDSETQNALINITLAYENTIGIPGDDLYPKS